MADVRPRSALDRVLAVLDGAEHQHSDEQGLPAGTSMEDGLAAPDDPSLCARCQHHPLGADGELCGGCREFLLGDTDTDPQAPPDWRDPSSYGSRVMARLIQQQQVRTEEQLAHLQSIRHGQLSRSLVAVDPALPGPLCHLVQRPDGVICHAADGRPLGVSYHHTWVDDMPPLQAEAVRDAAQLMADALGGSTAAALEGLWAALSSLAADVIAAADAAADAVAERRERERELSRAAVRDFRRAQRRGRFPR